MELIRVKELLEKYELAETTLQEEKQLKEYFTKNIVPKELEQYQIIFGYYLNSKEEVYTPKLFSKKEKNISYWSIAASALVFFGVGSYLYISSTKTYYPETVPTVDYGTYKDAKIAFEETQKALALLSKQVNQGVQSVSYVNEYNQTKKKIFK